MRYPLIQNAAQDFIRGLGYNCYGEAGLNYLGIAPAMGLMAGLGEMGRTNRLITPEYGPTVRIYKMITDLPLQPTKPIDFGLVKFCKVCKKCAINCPSKSLSMETEPYWETKGPWSNPGHKAWFEDSLTCHLYWTECGTGCSMCLGVCPFAKGGKAAMHNVVKAVSATTPVFDSAFVSMDDAIYGTFKDPKTWWDEERPEFGFDTTEGHGLK